MVPFVSSPGIVHLARLPLRSLNLSHLEHITDRALILILPLLLYQTPSKPSSAHPFHSTLHHQHHHQQRVGVLSVESALNVNGCLQLTDHLLRSLMELMDSAESDPKPASSHHQPCLRLLQLMHCPGIHSDTVMQLRKLLPSSVIAF